MGEQGFRRRRGGRSHPGLALAGLAVAFAFAGCGGPAPSPVATPVATSVPGTGPTAGATTPSPPPTPATPTPAQAATSPPTSAPTASPTPALTPRPTLDRASAPAVVAAIVAALRDGDGGALADFMGSTHVVGYWASEGVSLARTEAAALLLDELGPAASVQVAAGVDPALVAGPSWEQMFGPDVHVAAAAAVEGWGQAGTGRAVIYLVETAGGELSWFGTLINREGHV